MGNVALMEQLQVLQNKAAGIIVDLPPRTSATEARNKLGWKLLSRRGAEHRAIFMFNCPNNLFTHSFNVVLNREHHDRSTDNDVRLFQIETGVFGLRKILLRVNGII